MARRIKRRMKPTEIAALIRDLPHGYKILPARAHEGKARWRIRRHGADLAASLSTEELWPWLAEYAVHLRS